MTGRRVAVTGLGLISPFGGDLVDFFARLLAAESAIGFLRTDDVPRPLAMPFVGCSGFSAEAMLGRALAGTMDRFAQLGVAAAFGAWADAGFSRADTAQDREGWGVAWGTALGGTLAYENGYRDFWQQGRERLSPLALIRGMNNAANAHISIQLGLGGVSMSHTVACASSAIAIGEAFRRVRSGEAPVMLTGDNAATAAAIAAEAGIDDYRAGILPGDKAAAVNALKADGRRVAMVGDGINDAPALAAADVSFAIGAGSDAAIEVADVTLVRSDLHGVADAILLSRATLGKIRQNLFFAFIYNVLGIPLAALGLLNPVIAGAAMAMSSVSVVSNSLLLRRWRPGKR